jgi:glycyl-tRNA synthetase beta chain
MDCLMAELLLELFCEEIPARMQRDAAELLRKNIADKFTASGISFEMLTAYVTPRRLILHAIGLPTRTPDMSEEKRGPKIDAPEQAIAGFLKSTGLAKEQLTQRADGKATFFYALIEQSGRPSADVIAEIVPAVVRSFAWPKSMRWGERSATMDSLRWVRPLQSIVCLLDGEVVPFEIDGLRSGNVTRGHRFMSNSAFSVSGFEEYRTKLRLGRVIIDSDERAQIIEAAAKKLAADAGLDLVEDKGLLIENAGLTEWPVPLLGSFDADFLSVPPEVIQLTMRTNQKYFALRDGTTGALSYHFICTANIEASDGGKVIVEGNARVLAARLSDARFFWEQDRKKPLQDYLPKLEQIVFHEKLGTVADKVARVAKLARELAPACGADPDLAERAAHLCKADLVTGMVGEFPELQGVMGAYYATTSTVTPAKAGVQPTRQLTSMESATTVDPGPELVEGRRDEDVGSAAHPDISRAIAEHYAPQGPSDACPTAPVSVAVALADKLDSLSSFFAIDEKPTGSKDPFALRRSALGVIRLITENNLRLKIPSILIDFFADRLKVQQREQGVQHDLIDAVFALGGEDDLVRLLSRVKALQVFLGNEDGKQLLASYKRAANILKIEEKKDKRSYDGAVDAAKLTQAEETALHSALMSAQTAAATAIQAERFEAAMASLANLREPIDAFFGKVIVNADDPAVRATRLNLLAAIRAAVHTVADFSKIEG